EQLNALEPVWATIAGELGRDEHGQKYSQHQTLAEQKIHGLRPDEHARQDKQRSDEQRGLNARSNGDRKLRSIRSFIAAVTAVACSAAFPRIAITKTPTKILLRPSACAVGSIEPTRI